MEAKQISFSKYHLLDVVKEIETHFLLYHINFLKSVHILGRENSEYML
ncbi:hypothetical protein CHCC14809_0753 [Bacillus licheniformis]|uniref:Uncharacterized protein n=1 Tax=Bacillus paralicheniformis TaxID=1648923 RepID=A0A6I7TMR2_9BACI|nr:hypothetical protein SC10_B2orf04584 [Bacillus paralicheniformis]KYC76497.1 hypothetical protein B4090_3183 [Bacillus licheniformis]OLF96538.1 hypothetical protein B4121_0749 [Bacillus paralicheniformis]OLG08603.1 hypothetical protein B4125_0179 [Bacillus paralicheniformis]OLG10940.1 hypothetical protein B4123_2628 [Bacillus paralicheniformis]